ncbi:hypothetical protein B296_00047332 [Ensete ventricosum]|uniref:Uncharacterized protein n=1 Tax=Ensete ventricosum TaxID=4639 RepID=A0A426Z048_ENSVE|nr:hypothetical protein B296_00047332 [Ensete ventricosum]
MFVSRCQGWNFSVKWLAIPISNVPPNLTDEESIMVRQLKGILPASQAIRNLIEEWLVEAGLSPASRGTKRLTKAPSSQWKKAKVSSRHKSRREGKNSKSRVAKGKEPATPVEGTLTPRARSKSVKELYSAHPREDGQDCHVIRVRNQPEHAPDVPLEVNHSPLMHGMQIWQDDEAPTKYAQGM